MLFKNDEDFSRFSVWSFQADSDFLVTTFVRFGATSFSKIPDWNATYLFSFDTFSRPLGLRDYTTPSLRMVLGSRSHVSRQLSKQMKGSLYNLRLGATRGANH